MQNGKTTRSILNPPIYMADRISSHTLIKVRLYLLVPFLSILMVSNVVLFLVVFESVQIEIPKIKRRYIMP